MALFETMARGMFHAAAFNATERGPLIEALRADAKLRDFARQEVARLSEQNGILLERCHISKATHGTLTDALRVAEMPTAQIATIEAATE